VNPRGTGEGTRTGSRGPLTGDPLAARLFPPLPDQVRWGLERTERLLARVGHPQEGLPVLHVAGTNGKGSVARLWATVLQSAGFRVGLYTSPHLLSFRERILVNGEPLPDEFLEESAGELRTHLVKLAPSPFEAFTALSFLAFRRMAVDVAVVEVGMGGRLDATNVVSPILTAVTNVSLDHQQMLGATVRDIAREKAGILKAGVPAFTAAQDEDAIQVLREEAAALGVPLTRVLPAEGTATLEGVRLELKTRHWGDLELVCPMLGAHQIQNLSLAVRSLEALPPRFLPSRRAVLEGVAKTRVPGRLQREAEPPRDWLLDVAHNPAGASVLAESLRVLPFQTPRIGLIGVLSDKDSAGMLEHYASVLDRLLLLVPPSAPPGRQWDPEEASRSLPEGLRERVEVIRAEASESLAEALDRAMGRARSWTSTGGTVVVSGSFAIVGDVLRALQRIPEEALPPLSESG